MKNELQQKYISQPSFLPKLNLAKSIIRDSSKPNLYVPLHIDVDRKANIMRKRRRGQSVVDFLSSKVDFIDDENNRRIQIHKKRKVETIMPSVFKKSPVFMPQRMKRNSARLITLIEKVYIPQMQKQQYQYIAFTNHITKMDKTDMLQQLCSPRLLNWHDLYSD